MKKTKKEITQENEELHKIIGKQSFIINELKGQIFILKLENNMYNALPMCLDTITNN